MATIADSIRTQISTNIASYTDFAVSNELPFVQGDVPLYNKNMKRVYVDELQTEQVQLYRTLDQGEVYTNEGVVNAYLSVDAKNQPTNMDDVVTAILNAKSAISNVQAREALVTPILDDDVLTYEFEFNITNL